MPEENEEKPEKKSEEEKTPRQQFAEWLGSQAFYEIMYAYRTAPLFDQGKVVEAFECVKTLVRQKAKQIYEPDVHDDYITVYESVGGWKAVHMTWAVYEDLPHGFYEPEQTGVGAYATEEQAVVEAKSWAESEELEFIERSPPRN